MGRQLCPKKFWVQSAVHKRKMGCKMRCTKMCQTKWTITFYFFSGKLPALGSLFKLLFISEFLAKVWCRWSVEGSFRHYVQCLSMAIRFSQLCVAPSCLQHADAIELCVARFCNARSDASSMRKQSDASDRSTLVIYSFILKHYSRIKACECQVQHTFLEVVKA